MHGSARKLCRWEVARSTATEVRKPEVKKPVQVRDPRQVPPSALEVQWNSSLATFYWKQAACSVAAATCRGYFHSLFNACYWESYSSCR